MKKFFALYLMPPEEIDNMMANNTEEELTKMEDGWRKWQEEHKEAFILPWATLGKTKRVTASGIEDVRNALTGYSIIEAESHEEAAAFLATNPHMQMPGASVEVMELKEME